MVILKRKEKKISSQIYHTFVQFYPVFTTFAYSSCLIMQFQAGAVCMPGCCPVPGQPVHDTGTAGSGLLF